MGLPRTAKEAQNHGFDPVVVDFVNMTPAERKKWIRLNAAKRDGSLGLIRIIHKLNGTVILCFYDKNVKAFANCFKVEASAVGLD